MRSHTAPDYFVAQTPVPQCAIACQTAQPGDVVIPGHQFQIPGGTGGIVLILLIVIAIAAMPFTRR